MEIIAKKASTLSAESSAPFENHSLASFIGTNFFSVIIVHSSFGAVLKVAVETILSSDCAFPGCLAEKQTSRTVFPQRTKTRRGPTFPL